MTTRVGHWKKDRCEIYVGRGSIWGNPFATADVAARSRFKCTVVPNPIASFEQSLRSQPGLLNRVPELRGKAIGCYCVRLSDPVPFPGTERCHAQVLARIADGIDVNEPTVGPRPPRSRVAPHHPVLDGEPTMTLSEWYRRDR